ncbi:MAG: IS4 family transposase [Chloroflexota bacterium]
MKAVYQSSQSNSLVDEISTFLESMIQDLEPYQNQDNQPGRPRIVPAMCLWGALLITVLQGMQSQASIWRRISSIGLWHYPRFPVTDQAIYKRLAEGGTEDLQRLFKRVTQAVSDRVEPYIKYELAPFAKGIYALDVTTLDKVARILPSLRSVPAGDPRLLPGKLAAVFNIRRQQWHHVEHIASPTENDKVSARNLLDTIEKGSLILADLGYFGFKWFDDMTSSGFHWVSRFREKTSFEPIHIYYQDGDTFDGIIWLGKYRADQAKFAVRLVTFRRGNTVHRYITNVLDPKDLSLFQIAQLYARRWDIEMAFKLIKRELGLHLLWSAKTTIILQQVWAVLIISQILQSIRMEIAGKANVEPFDVSMKLLIEYMPIITSDKKDPIAIIVETGRRAGFIRPSEELELKHL